ncbi:MAG: hypothetical protein JNJ88_19940, partial [Planctomycetes bacterium]|nr:hypothetical protein [Planctomycetota bacterium]
MSTITRAPAAALAPEETGVAAILAEGYLRLAVRQRAERAARDSQGATPSARESLRRGKALRVARRFTGSLSGAPAGSVGVLSEAEGARPRAFGAHRAMKQKTKTVA